MAKPLLPVELWERIEPLLPPPKPRRFRFPGRKPLDNRKALSGILFILKTGIPWGHIWHRRLHWPTGSIWRKVGSLSMREIPSKSSVRTREESEEQHSELPCSVEPPEDRQRRNQRRGHDHLEDMQGCRVMPARACDNRIFRSGRSTRSGSARVSGGRR